MAADHRTLSHKKIDGDNLSTAATATEDTPLLRSEAVSSATPTPRAASPEAPREDDEGSCEKTIGWRRAVCIIISMWALIFLQSSNMSGMTMTQSIIAADLNAYENAMWFTSSYLITAASVAPVVGRLAMIFSPSSLILMSAFFFALGAIVASQAHSFAVFILGRVLVGVGGGGVMTLAMIFVLQLTSKRRRGVFVGLTNAGFTIGLSTGAVVYGALLPTIGWRALFWLQSPVGLLAGLGVYLSIPDFVIRGSPNGKSTIQKLASIDYGGAITLTLTIVLFLYGLSDSIRGIPISASLATLVLFVVTEYYVASDPIIPLAVLRSRGVLLSCVSQLGFMAARWTLLYYAPVFVLAVRGLSPALAGSVLIPTNAGFGSGGLIVGWLHVRRSGSFWLPCLVSLLFFSATLFSLSFLSNATAPAWLYVCAVFLNGFGTGAALNYTLAHLLHLSPSNAHFITTSLLATFRGFAGSFGTAIGGGVFSRTLRSALTSGFNDFDGTDDLSQARKELVTRLLGSPALVFGGDLTDSERAIAVCGYEQALKILYRSAAALCIFVLVVQAGTGWSEPATEGDEEDIEEAIAEHSGAMEA
ncbi:hypothetical protein VTK73DRAFT_6709 [Phialemonium thermophilum]|uniref:Major facilitator superfamily (MFS) profile domain-containing protein n=1 Tax=Phialemonium thermophilum TaxID=223376 RepID=A0ABR3XWH9_9PEZI